MQATFFNGMARKPFNYRRVDDFLSVSAVLYGTSPKWLKKQGVTDVVSFRTFRDMAALKEERKALKKRGIRLHNIPSITAHPTKENVMSFFALAKQVKNEGGKLHAHCVQGANRTGMYRFLYEMANNTCSLKEGLMNWLAGGLTREKYPNLMEWAIRFFYDNEAMIKRGL